MTSPGPVQDSEEIGPLNGSEAQPRIKKSEGYGASRGLIELKKFRV